MYTCTTYAKKKNFLKSPALVAMAAFSTMLSNHHTLPGFPTFTQLNACTSSFKAKRVDARHEIREWNTRESTMLGTVKNIQDLFVPQQVTATPPSAANERKKASSAWCENELEMNRGRQRRCHTRITILTKGTLTSMALTFRNKNVSFCSLHEKWTHAEWAGVILPVVATEYLKTLVWNLESVL